MKLLWLGLAVWVITGTLFWYSLPRHGKVHRFVGTELEPYVAVAFCAGVALGGCMIFSSIFPTPPR
jgi:hypothetical protein